MNPLTWSTGTVTPFARSLQLNATTAHRALGLVSLALTPFGRSNAHDRGGDLRAGVDRLVNIFFPDLRQP